MTPSRNVPASLNPTIQMRNGVLLDAPSVAVSGTTIEVAAVRVMSEYSSSAAAWPLMSTLTGLNALGSLPAAVLTAIVRAFEATEAIRFPPISEKPAPAATYLRATTGELAGSEIGKLAPSDTTVSASRQG